MLAVVSYKAEHLMDLQLQPGQRHIAFVVTPEYALELEGPDSFTILDGSRVLMVGGLCRLWRGRALVWSFVDADAGPHFTAIHKIVKNFLSQAPVDRIEADVPTWFTAGKRWLKLLGFELECACAKKHQPNGDDSALYALVR